jgi:hypothetical protein
MAAAGFVVVVVDDDAWVSILGPDGVDGGGGAGKRKSQMAETGGKGSQGGMVKRGVSHLENGEGGS